MLTSIGSRRTWFYDYILTQHLVAISVKKIIHKLFGLPKFSQIFILSYTFISLLCGDVAILALKFTKNSLCQYDQVIQNHSFYAFYDPFNEG